MATAATAAKDAPEARIRQGSTEAYRPTTEEVVHIHGYLHKLTRDGKWQRRWFETNGSFLTYYKSKRMTKLLAALSLPQCGDIRAVDAIPPLSATASPLPPAPPRAEGEGVAAPPDPAAAVPADAGLFTIGLNERTYTLRAPTRTDAECWVKTLLLLKHQGSEFHEDTVAKKQATPPKKRPAEWEKRSRSCTTTFCWAPCRPG